MQLILLSYISQLVYTGIYEWRLTSEVILFCRSLILYSTCNFFTRIKHISRSPSNRIRPSGFTVKESGEVETQGGTSRAGMSPAQQGSLRQGWTWLPTGGFGIKTNNPGVPLKTEANGARWWLLDVLWNEKKLNSVRWWFLMHISDAMRRLVGW